MAASLAAGMSVVLSAVPVCAAGSENADAAGKQKSVTVSEQLKGIQSTGTVADESILDGIKTSKGTRKFHKMETGLHGRQKERTSFIRGQQNRNFRSP